MTSPGRFEKLDHPTLAESKDAEEYKGDRNDQTITVSLQSQIADVKGSIKQAEALCGFFTFLDTTDFISDMTVLQDLDGALFWYYLMMSFGIHMIMFAVSMGLIIQNKVRKAKALMFIPVVSFMSMLMRTTHLVWDYDQWLFYKSKTVTSKIRAAYKAMGNDQTLETLEILKKRKEESENLRSIIDSNSMYLKVFEDVNQLALLMFVVQDSNYAIFKIITSGMATVFTLISLRASESWEKKSHYLLWLLPSIVIGSTILTTLITGGEVHMILSSCVLGIPIILKAKFKEIKMNKEDLKKDIGMVSVFCISVVGMMACYVLNMIQLYTDGPGIRVVTFYSCVLVLWLIHLIKSSILIILTIGGLTGLSLAGLVLVSLNSMASAISWFTDQLTMGDILQG